MAIGDGSETTSLVARERRRLSLPWLDRRSSAPASPASGDEIEKLHRVYLPWPNRPSSSLFAGATESPSPVSSLNRPSWFRLLRFSSALLNNIGIIITKGIRTPFNNIRIVFSTNNR
ncbi:unnamed protein product [Linum tenue]|uniref:Uncharacterized protein n=1 Tax=Linum tenue TaxID=586396 RepID=A0AAV0REZ9_9ROSI|nr:unnamed protein product [Linum tenue]